MYKMFFLKKTKKIWLICLLFLVILTTGCSFYGKDENIPTLSDFLGNWDTHSGHGHHLIEISKKNNIIKIHQYDYSSVSVRDDTIFECKYDNRTGSLVCFRATHIHTWFTCNGYSSDDDDDNDTRDEFFEECQKNPDLEPKEESRTYTDTTKRIIKIKKGTKEHFVIDREGFSDEEFNYIKQDCENMKLYFEEEEEEEYVVYYYKYKDKQEWFID